MNESKNPQGRPRKDEQTWNQDHIDQTDIDTIFSTVPTGYAIQVHREEPEWAKGYLGKIYCVSDDPINLDTLKKRFGGNVLTLRFENARKQFKGSKRVVFHDPPKREGLIITEDDPYGLKQKSSNEQNNQGFSGMIPPGLPPQLAAQILAFYSGYQLPQPQPQEPKQNPIELMQTTQIMNMMNAQMEAQQTLMKSNMEHMKEMERIRRESEEDRERRRRLYEKDKEPLSEVHGAITLIRELNGIKGELGSTDTTAQIITNAAPILENAIGELIELQKMKMQAALAKAVPNQSYTPALPPRILSQPASKNGNGHDDPVELARQMRRVYDNLPVEQQTAVMSAFLGPDNSENENEQTIDSDDNERQNLNREVSSGDGLLSPEDMAELAQYERAESQEIPNGEHAATTENDNTSNRSSD